METYIEQASARLRFLSPSPRLAVAEMFFDSWSGERQLITVERRADICVMHIGPVLGWGLFCPITGHSRVAAAPWGWLLLAVFMGTLLPYLATWLILRSREPLKLISAILLLDVIVAALFSEIACMDPC